MELFSIRIQRTFQLVSTSCEVLRKEIACIRRNGDPGLLPIVLYLLDLLDHQICKLLRCLVEIISFHNYVPRSLSWWVSQF